MENVHETLRDNGISWSRIEFEQLAPNPVSRLVGIAKTGIDAFSIIFDPDALGERSGELLGALNIHRDGFAREGICAVFWMRLRAQGLPTNARLYPQMNTATPTAGRQRKSFSPQN